MVTKEDIYKYNYWKHRISFDDDDVTPGTYGHKWAEMGLPDNLSGKTFLEVGAYDGMYSFEAERRGAERVLATDIWELEDVEGSVYNNRPNQQGFNLIREYVDSSVESQVIDIVDLSPDEIGRFDVTLCMNVLTHTNYPLWGLKRLASVTNDSLVLLTGGYKSDDSVPRVQMVGDPTEEFSNQRWLINKPAIRYIISNIFEFSQIDISEPAFSHGISDLTRHWLDEPVTVYKDYDLDAVKREIPAGVIVTIRAEHEGKVCLGDWSDADTHRMQRIGWTNQSELQMTPLADCEKVPFTDINKRALSKHYGDGIVNGLSESVNYISRKARNKMATYSNDTQTSYLVHASK